MIESPEVRTVLRMEIQVSDLTKLKEEFHSMKMSSSTLDRYPQMNGFYEDLVNVLAGLDGV